MKREAIQELHTLKSEGNKVYLPLAENEKIVYIDFKKPVYYTITAVEDLENPIEGEANLVNLNYMKSFCLIIETEEDTEIEVLTIK